MSGTATSYALKYSTSAAITEATWPSATSYSGSLPTPAPAGTAESMVVSGLNPSTAYWFSLKAFDEAWNYSMSNSASGITASGTAGATTTLPAAPSNLAAIVAANGADVNLAWTDTSANETEFKIFQRSSGGSWSFVAAVGTNITSRTIIGLAAGTYEYAVRACNAYGCSQDSNAQTVTVSAIVATTTVSAVMEGTVKDTAGQPLANATVHIFKKDFSQSFSGVSNADGSFRISLSPGTYLAEVFPPPGRYDLLKPTPLEVSIGGGETRKITLQFVTAAKTIIGSVAFSDGKPITDAEVGAYSSETQKWKSAFVDGSGRYTLTVGGGKWQVNVHPKDSSIAAWRWTGQPTVVAFANDSVPETRTVNFSVPVSDAKLIVRTRDASGNVIQNADVVVDTVSVGQSFAGETRIPPQFRGSGASGVAEFSVRAGTYYIRAFLPRSLGYLNPNEQAVTAGSSETKEVVLVFRRSEAAATASLQGVTKLESGTPTDAFVWAWSLRGESREGRSAADGTFNFSVPPDSQWHIGARKEANGFPYASSDIIITVDKAAAFAELTLVKVGMAPLAPAVFVTQTAMQQVVVQAKDGARVMVPAGAAAATGSVKVEVRPTVEAPSQAAAKVVSTVYNVTIADAAGKKVTLLQAEAEIVLPYKEEDLKMQGVTENAIVPSFFDESAGAWRPCENYAIDKEKKVAVCRVKHLTRFALIAAADVTPPNAPADAKAVRSGPSEIALSWKNPTADFSHAKVYRSTVKGVLGTVILNNIVSGQGKDKNAVAGVSYHYAVRSVDPAGNESTNTNQVSEAGVSAAAFTRNLKRGTQGDDVRLLQQILLGEGVYPEALLTGYFGKLTEAAVVRFQEKYANDILKSVGLTKGTGFVGPSTRAKLNAPPGFE